MAHYAIINSSNIVTNVFVGKDEGQGTDWEQEYAKYHPGHIVRRTSYNTYAGKYYSYTTVNGVLNRVEAEDQSKAFRKNFAYKNSIWDEGRDAFYAPCQFPSWTLNEATCIWEAPILPQQSDYPTDEEYLSGVRLIWNEDTQSWSKGPSLG